VRRTGPAAKLIRGAARAGAPERTDTMAELEFIGRALKGLFGSRNDRIVRSLAPIVGRVNALEPAYEGLSDAKLRAKTQEFKDRLKKGETLDDLLPEAFAACRESAKRTLGMRHFDVQILGGVVLHQGKIAEMATGEGKTLVATLPCYLNALAGQGVHVVTVNDYLARRDAKWMGPVCRALGLEVGVIQSQMPPHIRIPQYRADITYGTNSEFGFDYLRDNMKLRLEDQCQQGRHFFAVVDEVDSILIDEARTPLIIAGTADDSTDRYYVADRAVKQLVAGDHFEVNEKDHHVVLTEDGTERIHELLSKDLGGGSMYDAANIEWVHHVDVALKGNYLYKRDKEYVVDDEGEGPEVIIVDEFTGRKMKGRRWSDGLHQAVEAKEGLQIREENQTLATITYQNFFRLYDKLGGMTGTALTEAEEFSKIYNLDVISIPTNRRMRRGQAEDLIYRTEREKLAAVVEDIVKTHEAGRPLLIGTTSVEKSERLSSMLQAKGIAHELLNAKQHEREAHIIAKAGQAGAVTLATNMAGRGTDIILGPGVAEKGGLHVVGTERHEARRIDNQLRGRAGRQGDPGSSQFFMSLEDDLMRIFAKQWVSDFLGKLGMEEGEEIQSGMVSRMIERVQRKMESHNFDIRKNLLEYDAVNNEQRKVVYGWRQAILDGRDQLDRVAWAVQGLCEELSNHHMVVEEGAPPDVAGLRRAFQQRFQDEAQPESEFKNRTPETAAVLLAERGNALYAKKRNEVGAERMQELERYVVLQTIDEKWKDHLQALDYLRTGIGMRGYGQEDPKIVYRREAANFFEHMIGAIRGQVVELLFRIQPAKEEPLPEDRDDEPAGDPPAPDGPPAFDEDDWGSDDDGVEWDKVVARESLQRIAAAMEQEMRAAQAPAPGPSATLSGMDDDGGAPTASL